MYSSEDLERFYFQYQVEAVPYGMSLSHSVQRITYLTIPFYKWYKDTCRKIVEVQVNDVFLRPTSESVPSSPLGENSVKKDSPFPHVGNK